MQITTGQLARLLNGRVEGDPDALIDRPSRIEEGGKGSISFLSNPKYEEQLYSTTATAVLVSEDFVPRKPVSATLIRVRDVYAALAFLLEHFGREQQGHKKGISDRAEIHPEAEIGQDVYIGPFVVVERGAKIGAHARLLAQVYVGEEAEIGEGAVLHPGVKIYRACSIGRHCILHANVVVGSDGFGFAPQEDGSYKKVPQLGRVVIEDEVEIGANTVIDRATMGATLIGRGVKLDNLIQVAHNVRIGDHTVIAAQTGIAGSTQIGKHTQIGGQVGFVGHIRVADGVKIQAQSGIAASIEREGSAWYGSPAIPYRDFLRSYAVFKQLPDLLRRLKEVEKNCLPDKPQA